MLIPAPLPGYKNDKPFPFVLSPQPFWCLEPLFLPKFPRSQAQSDQIILQGSYYLASPVTYFPHPPRRTINGSLFPSSISGNRLLSSLYGADKPDLRPPNVASPPFFLFFPRIPLRPKGSRQKSATLHRKGSPSSPLVTASPQPLMPPCEKSSIIQDSLMGAADKPLRSLHKEPSSEIRDLLRKIALPPW